VSKYVIPRKAYITRKKTPGTKYDYDVYDSTAMMANIILAAGLHSYLTNPNSRWFSLRVQNEEINKDENVKIWLADTEERLYNTLNASNFNQQIHELYLDLGAFGVACMYEEEDPVDG
jgi:homoserine trans-succinylase